MSADPIVVRGTIVTADADDAIRVSHRLSDDARSVDDQDGSSKCVEDLVRAVVLSETFMKN